LSTTWNSTTPTFSRTSARSKPPSRRLINLIPRNGQLLANGDDPNLAPLLDVTHCPVKRFGLGADNSVHGFNLRYGPTASEFEIPSFKFHLNLVGELNVRNALAVVACAKHCGLSNKQIQSAFDTFKGVKPPHGSARRRRRHHGAG
jgi:UDP-N-acetylmuramyl pentapeptide synthase